MQRLKTRAQFEAVMAGGATVSRTTHFALHRASLDPVNSRLPTQASTSSEQPATGGHFVEQPTGPGSEGSAALFAVTVEPWLGAIVPKRWARRAVTRNAIKRQIYIVSQDYEAQMPAAAHVVRLRSGFDKTTFPSATSPALKKLVRQELQQLFGGMRK